MLVTTVKVPLEKAAVLVASDTSVYVNFVTAGISAAVRARNVGVAAPPEDGPANTVFALWVVKVPVKVPVVVTGDPLTLKIEGNDNATLVTPVFATVIDPAPFVILMPVRRRRALARRREHS
jgi:hypothetical protein